MVKRTLPHFLGTSFMKNIIIFAINNQNILLAFTRSNRTKISHYLIWIQSKAIFWGLFNQKLTLFIKKEKEKDKWVKKGPHNNGSQRKKVIKRTEKNIRSQNKNQKEIAVYRQLFSWLSQMKKEQFTSPTKCGQNLSKDSSNNMEVCGVLSLKFGKHRE